jgi:hypothetical protein
MSHHVSWKLRAMPATVRLPALPEQTVTVDLDDRGYAYVQRVRAVVLDETASMAARRSALNELHVFFEAAFYLDSPAVETPFRPTPNVKSHLTGSDERELSDRLLLLRSLHDDHLGLDDGATSALARRDVSQSAGFAGRTPLHV